MKSRATTLVIGGGGLALLLAAPTAAFSRQNQIFLAQNDAVAAGSGVDTDGPSPAATGEGDVEALRVDVQERVAEALRAAGFDSKDIDDAVERIGVHVEQGSTRRRWPQVNRSRLDRGEYVVTGSSGKVEAGEEVEQAVVIGGSLTVLGRVRREAVAVGGAVSLGPNGYVEGDVAAIGGSINLAPGALVEGDATAIGGSVNVPERAIVEGDQVSMDGAVGTIVGTLVGLSTGRGDGDNDDASLLPGYRVGVLFSLAQMLTLFTLALLLLAFVPERIEAIEQFLIHKPGPSALGGLALAVGFVPLCLVLAISVFGIPLIPIASLALLCVLVVGSSTLAIWIGQRLPLLRQHKSPITALSLGVLLLTVLTLVPVVGYIAVLLASFVAGGAVVLSRFGSMVHETPATISQADPK